MEQENLGNNQKKAVVDKELAFIYPKLVANSELICSYNSDNWAEDLLTIVIEYFMKMDLDKQYDIVTTPSKNASSLEKYLTKSMSLSVKSSTSPFYRQFRMKMESHRELITDFDYTPMIGHDNPDEENIWEENLDNVRDIVSSLHYYDRYLIDEHYFKGKRLDEISETTQISTWRLSKDIKLALLKLKEKLK